MQILKLKDLNQMMTFQKEDGMDIGMEPYSGELLDMIKSGGMMSRLKAMKEKGEI